MSEAKILNGDCLQLIQALPDNHFEAVITDPPYSSGAVLEAQKQSAGRQGIRNNVKNQQRFTWFTGNNMTTAGILFLIRNLGVELERVCKEGASILVFCDWRMAIQFVPALESCGLIYRNLIVWDKGHFGMGNGFRNQHELIIHLTKGKGIFHSASFSNVLSCGRTYHEKERIHPTEKPVKLLADLLQVVTKEGDHVFDPFCGSGSLAEACLRLNRGFTGIEKDKIYHKKAEDRVASLSNSQLLFDLNDQPTEEQGGQP